MHIHWQQEIAYTSGVCLVKDTDTHNQQKVKQYKATKEDYQWLHYIHESGWASSVTEYSLTTS